MKELDVLLSLRETLLLLFLLRLLFSFSSSWSRYGCSSASFSKILFLGFLAIILVIKSESSFFFSRSRYIYS